MTPTQKIIEEFKEKFSKPELKRVECEGVGDNNGFYEFTPKIITVENIEDFLLSSLHQVATEAIEAVRLELKTKDTEVILLNKDIQGYNTAVFLMEQKAKEFLENNF